ncbi:unnamed protein product [Pseudo-nitzschia multistriata]|uniref:D-isomer specific 2-hydroxyacid dehydrogenase NAD-binding domain-containing protein n=1 Tax=Pseudo-nitzschia multistriata TaxID=183589 RepID=A0A448ZCL0_9STRA|nr:unnamed protein product [Pseudo-nitzschia multistriata]
MPGPPPVVTVFSSIPAIAEALSSCEGLALDVVEDGALTGYGGTVEFDPRNLSPATFKALERAVVLVSEPAVVASLLGHEPQCLRNLRWCQSTYAGVDPLFAPGIAHLEKPWILTRFAGVFGPPIAEWCLARIIGHERSFAASALDQRRREWAGSREAVGHYRYLSSLTLSVLGCGDIGRCIARAASALGMRTVGFGRIPRAQGDLEGVEKYTLDLGEALRAGDYVVSVLPSTPETRGLLGGSALAAAAGASGGKSPVLLNVGRGDVIDEESLLSALESGYISAAILDVFEKEPLPRDSPLWNTPGVVVSPHVSGLTQASDVPGVLLANYQRYVEGNDLLYVVDWDKGY